MKKSEIKLFITLLTIIVISAIILIIKINSTPKYDEKLYAEVYEEYNQLLNSTNDANSIDTDSFNVNNTTDNTNINAYTNNTSINYKYKVVATIGIPDIGLFSPILSNASDEYLKVAPSKLSGGEPNAVGNFCIAGHNYRNNTHFSKLSSLKNDSVVKLSDRSGNTINYKVYNMYKVNATDTSCLNQNTNGQKELTLITCTNNKNIRLIVKCKAS